MPTSYSVTDLDQTKLRLGFVVYGGMNRKDWRTVSIEDVTADASDVKRALVPMLRTGVRPKDADIAVWTATLIRETRDLMAAVLPLADNERDFWNG